MKVLLVQDPSTNHNLQAEVEENTYSPQEYGYEDYGSAASAYEYDDQLANAYQEQSYEYETALSEPFQQLWLDDSEKYDQFYSQIDNNKDSKIYQEFHCNSIPVRKIQNILCTVNDEVATLSLDSGCEGDCIRKDECERLGITITSLDHTDSVPTQADGNSNLDVVGKAKFVGIRDKVQLEFDGYAVSNLQAKILCGAPFLSRNKIVQELHNNKIVIDNKFHILES